MSKFQRSLQRVLAAMEAYNEAEGIQNRECDPSKPHQLEWLEAYNEAKQLLESRIAISPSQGTSIGELRVRTTFNPDKSDLVSLIKESTAELINLCQAIKNDETVKPENDTKEKLQENAGEKFRLIALAQTSFEEGAMWAVKAATA